MEYNTGLFRAETIEQFVGHDERLLTEIVEEPEPRLSQFDPFREKERS